MDKKSSALLKMSLILLLLHREIFLYINKIKKCTSNDPMLESDKMNERCFSG